MLQYYLNNFYDTDQDVRHVLGSEGLDLVTIYSLSECASSESSETSGVRSRAIIVN
jgi:hypothetical protein